MKKYGALVLLLAIVPLATSVYAQGGNLVQLSGGYTISLPSGWEQAESEGVYTFSQGDLSIVLTLPDALVSKLELADTTDAADVLVEAYATMSDQTLDKRPTSRPKRLASAPWQLMNSRRTTVSRAGSRWCWRSHPASSP